MKSAATYSPPCPCSRLACLVRAAPRARPALKVGAALPDPPFEFISKDGPAGFDIALMQRIGRLFGRGRGTRAVPGRRLQRYLRRSQFRHL